MVATSRSKLPSSAIAKYSFTSAGAVFCTMRIASWIAGGVAVRATQLANYIRSRRIVTPRSPKPACASIAPHSATL